MDLQLRSAEKAIQTLRVRNRPAFQRQYRRKTGTAPAAIHYVEPQALPSETYSPRKKIYSQVRSTKGAGIPVTDLGSVYVAKLSKSVYDVITCTHLLCRNAKLKCEIKTAVRWFHTLRRYFSQREDIFGNSRFVRQSLRVLSITLRLTKSHLRWKDAHTVGNNRDCSFPRERSSAPILRDGD
jgi:hypothetical protein